MLSVREFFKQKYECLLPFYTDINAFSIKSQQWGRKTFEEKLTQFDGCQIRISGSGKQNSDLDIIFKLLEKKLNFTLNITIPTISPILYAKSHIDKTNDTFYYYIYDDVELTILIPLGEKYTSYPSGIQSSRLLPFYKLLKDNIQSLFESGIIPKVFRERQILFLKKLLKIVEVPKASYFPLNLTMLEAGFVIWLVVVGISIFVFMIEIIHFKFMKKIKNYRKKKVKKKSKLNSKGLKLKYDLIKKTKFLLVTVYEHVKEKIMRH